MPPATAARLDSLLVTPRWNAQRLFQAWRSRSTRAAPIKPGLDALARRDRRRTVGCGSSAVVSHATSCEAAVVALIPQPRLPPVIGQEKGG